MGTAGWPAVTPARVACRKTLLNPAHSRRHPVKHTTSPAHCSLALIMLVHNPNRANVFSGPGEAPSKPAHSIESLTKSFTQAAGLPWAVSGPLMIGQISSIYFAEYALGQSLLFRLASPSQSSRSNILTQERRRSIQQLQKKKSTVLTRGTGLHGPAPPLYTSRTETVVNFSL